MKKTFCLLSFFCLTSFANSNPDMLEVLHNCKKGISELETTLATAAKKDESEATKHLIGKFIENAHEAYPEIRHSVHCWFAEYENKAAIGGIERSFHALSELLQLIHPDDSEQNWKFLENLLVKIYYQGAYESVWQFWRTVESLEVARYLVKYLKELSNQQRLTIILATMATSMPFIQSAQDLLGDNFREIVSNEEVDSWIQSIRLSTETPPQTLPKTLDLSAPENIQRQISQVIAIMNVMQFQRFNPWDNAMEEGVYKFHIQHLLYGQIHYSIFKDHPKLVLNAEGRAMHSLMCHKAELVKLFENTERVTEVINNIFPNIHTLCELPHFCRIGFEGIVAKLIGSSNYKLRWGFRASAVRDCAINIAYALLPGLSKPQYQAEFDRYEVLAQAIVEQAELAPEFLAFLESGEKKGKPRPVGSVEAFGWYSSIEFNTLRVQGLFSPSRVYFQLQAIGGK